MSELDTGKASGHQGPYPPFLPWGFLVVTLAARAALCGGGQAGAVWSREARGCSATVSLDVCESGGMETCFACLKDSVIKHN